AFALANVKIASRNNCPSSDPRDAHTRSMPAIVSRLVLPRGRRRRSGSGLAPSFFGATALQHVLECVVALVALDGEQRDVGCGERPFGGPWRCPGLGILDGHAISKRFLVDAREALDDMEALARVEIVRVPAEVCRV